MDRLCLIGHSRKYHNIPKCYLFLTPTFCISIVFRFSCWILLKDQTRNTVKKFNQRSSQKILTFRGCYVQGFSLPGTLQGFLDTGVLTRGLSNISKPFLISPAISIYGGHFYIRFLPSVQWLLYLRHSMEKNKLNIKHKSVLYERLLSPF